MVSNIKYPLRELIAELLCRSAVAALNRSNHQNAFLITVQMCRSSASGIPSVRRSFLLAVHLSHPVHLSLHSPVLSNIVSSFLTHFKTYFLFSFLAFLHDFSVFSFFPHLSAHSFTIFLIPACPAAAPHSIPNTKNQRMLPYVVSYIFRKI